MTVREETSDFVCKLSTLFGLEEQGKEVVTWVKNATGCKQVCLLFLGDSGKEYSALSYLPKSRANAFSHLRLSQQNPIVNYLRQEQKPLSRETLSGLFSSGVRKSSHTESASDKVEVFVPLVSRNKLLGILALGQRNPGSGSNEVYDLLGDITASVAASLEKEYLREQLGRQKRKLSKLYAEAEKRSRIDGMTGLLNRRALDEALANEINRSSRYGGVFSLIIFDIDGALRTVNNTFGHPTGDKLLKQIGAIAKRQIRSSDQAFRIYGGDEFAILLPNTPLDAADRVAERIRKQLPSVITPDSSPVTASLGIACWPAHGKDADAIFAAADAALYKAKHNGGNQSQHATSAQTV